MKSIIQYINETCKIDFVSIIKHELEAAENLTELRNLLTNKFHADVYEGHNVLYGYLSFKRTHFNYEIKYDETDPLNIIDIYIEI